MQGRVNFGAILKKSFILLRSLLQSIRKSGEIHEKTVNYLRYSINFAISLLVLVPKVAAQTTDDIKVLNYSYHIDLSGGTPLLVVVGEVKNEGSTAYQMVAAGPIAGTVYAADGSIQAQSPGYIYTIYLVPGRKCPLKSILVRPKLPWMEHGFQQALTMSILPFKQLKQATMLAQM